MRSRKPFYTAFGNGDTTEHYNQRTNGVPNGRRSRYRRKQTPKWSQHLPHRPRQESSSPRNSCGAGTCKLMGMVGTTRKAVRKIHETSKYSIQSILPIPLIFFVPFLDFLPDEVVDETASTELLGAECERALHFSQARLPNSRPSLFSLYSAVF